MTYLSHLLNLTRLKAGLWVFLAGIVASVLVSIQSLNIATLTWNDIKFALIAAIISQITKALSNYGEQNDQGYPQQN